MYWFNHRFNVLGYTDLSNYGEEYEYSGNAGQNDLVMVLVGAGKHCAFGGAPENVTIIGQSGGSKVACLMGTPIAAGLFDKAITCSGGGATTQTTETSPRRRHCVG